MEIEQIPPELILNWDHTGIKIVPSSSWTMEQQGTKHVDLVGAGDKRLITAVFCGSLVGDFCQSKLFMQARHHGAIHAMTSHQTGISSIRRSADPMKLPQSSTFNIIIPYVNKTRETFKDDTPALIIMDNLKGQITSDRQ